MDDSKTSIAMARRMDTLLLLEEALGRHPFVSSLVFCESPYYFCAPYFQAATGAEHKGAHAIDCMANPGFDMESEAVNAEFAAAGIDHRWAQRAWHEVLGAASDLHKALGSEELERMGSQNRILRADSRHAAGIAEQLGLHELAAWITRSLLDPATPKPRAPPPRRARFEQGKLRHVASAGSWIRVKSVHGHRLRA